MFFVKPFQHKIRKVASTYKLFTLLVTITILSLLYLNYYIGLYRERNIAEMATEVP